MTPIFHPNIDKPYISLNILELGWTEDLTIHKGVLSIISLLTNVEEESMLENEAALLYRKDK